MKVVPAVILAMYGLRQQIEGSGYNKALFYVPQVAPVAYLRGMPPKLILLVPMSHIWTCWVHKGQRVQSRSKWRYRLA
jgi:hypothetical protein